MYQCKKEELKTRRYLREVIQKGLENIGLYDREKWLEVLILKSACKQIEIRKEEEGE